MHSGCWNCMHVWFTYVFSNHRDSKFPNINFFIISSRDKSSSILNECDRVDRAKMLLILLNDFFLVCIKLENLLVRTTSKKNILLIFCWMEFDAKRCSLVCVTSNDLSSFSVPQLDYSIKTCTQKSSAIIGKTNIPHSFLMTLISPYAFSVSHNIPNFDRTVMTCTQQKMTSLRKEFYSLYTFIVT